MFLHVGESFSVKVTQNVVEDVGQVLRSRPQRDDEEP